MAVLKKALSKLKGSGSGKVRATPRRTGGVKPGKSASTPRKPATPVKRAIKRVAKTAQRKKPTKGMIGKLAQAATKKAAPKRKTGGLKGALGRATGGAVRRAYGKAGFKTGGTGGPTGMLPKNRRRRGGGGGEGGRN